MTKSKINDKQMWAKIRATQRAAIAAKEAGGRALGGAFVEAVDELTPKDTNRLANGWLDAGRKAGVSTRPLRSIVASKNQDRYLEKLEAQIEFWQARRTFAQRMQKRYEDYDASAPPRKDGKRRKKRTSQPYYRKMKRLEKKAAKNIVRAGEELEKALGGDGFIFFDADSIVQRKQNRSLSTVRSTVYGGEGETNQVGEKLVVTLTNKEPHVRIVEKHPHLGHPVASALEIIRSFGIRKVSRKYRQRLIEGTPMGNKKAA